MPYVTLRYERAKLYEEVRAEAVTTVAKRYGISDVALRKICRKLAVPLPPLGYWAKIAAGKKTPYPAASQIFRPGNLFASELGLLLTGTTQIDPKPTYGSLDSGH